MGRSNPHLFTNVVDGPLNHSRNANLTMVELANAKDPAPDNSSDLYDREFLRRGVRFSSDKFRKDHAPDAWD